MVKLGLLTDGFQGIRGVGVMRRELLRYIVDAASDTPEH